MNDEINEAFSHPAARSEATAAERDRLLLRDHVVSAEIGAFQAERGSRQRLRFNVVVEIPRNDAPLADDVDRILSYDTLTEAIEIELAAERLNLLETLAERVAARILAEPRARRVFLRIEKLDRGPGALGVEIVRSGGEGVARMPPQEAQGAAAHPVVVFLSNEAIRAPALPEWLDRLETRAAPAILAVGLPEGPRPRAGTAPTQRRIDLLAIEQNAWVLAARDPRCVVTHSRTEIDWAVKHGQICVWAPSKIVLDSIERPRTPPAEALALARWFATEIGAARLVAIGAEGPGEAEHLSLAEAAARL